MSIKYNGKTIAGKYKAQIVTDATETNKGIIRVATDAEVNAGTDNTTAVTPKKLATKADKTELNTLSEEVTDLSGRVTANEADILTKQDKLTAGTGISIENNVVSNTQTSAEWGNIKGDITTQTDLNTALGKKQDNLTFDSTPTANSTNPVTSGGIKTALDLKANSTAVVQLSGNQTVAGTKTFSSTIVGNLQGNVTGDVTGSSGSCTGNAATATKATQDSSGNNIVNTYATKTELNAKANTSLSNITDAGKTVIKNNALPTQTGNAKKVLTTDGTTASWQNPAGGLDLATVVCMPFGIDESENKYRYLNGQTIIQEQFPEFTKKVKSWQSTRANLFATETNWQAEKTASKLGQCGKFVVDDTAGTIRLPLVININGLTDLADCGVIKDESLPNIKGNLDLYKATEGISDKSGAFSNSYAESVTYATHTGQTVEAQLRIRFDANKSSSTYQDNAPVQQEAIQYPYVICVNTGVEETERPINNYQVNNVYSYGMSQYYKGTMNNNSWLRSSGQWNSGTVYNGVYEWAVAQQVAGVDGFKLSTEEYTDYDWVLNTTDETFRLPLLDGSENLVSNKYEDLELKSSGMQYTAPANGWLILNKVASGANQEIRLKNTSNNMRGYTISSSGNAALSAEVACRKDDLIDVYYSTGGATEHFRFIYSQGNGNLYYYIGDTLQNADLINIARLGEELVDIKITPHIVETYVSGTSGYRIWSKDSTGYRYCEQWGRLTYRSTEADIVVSLLQKMKDTNYSCQITVYGGTSGYTSAISGHFFTAWSLTESSFTTHVYINQSVQTMWKVSGYISD